MAVPTRTVLVVDEGATIQLLETALRCRGFQVMVAPDGRAALALLAAAIEPPSLIVLDVESGFLDERERRPDLTAIPVVVMSDAAAAFAPLTNGVAVVKPVTAVALMLSIELLI